MYSMRRLRLFFVFLFFLVITTFACYAEETSELRDYSGIEVVKGTFIPVMSAQEISTAYNEEGTKVKFISTNDLYLYDTNIIPKNTEFFGYIEKLNEPIIGTNASMVIKINKLRLVDGFEIPMNAYIYSTNNNIIGGELTPPAKYDKMPHYQKGLAYGTLQFVPGATRAMGVHTVIAAGADMIVILTRPIWITHTLTN